MEYLPGGNPEAACFRCTGLLEKYRFSYDGDTLVPWYFPHTCSWHIFDLQPLPKALLRTSFPILSAWGPEFLLTCAVLVASKAILLQSSQNEAYNFLVPALFHSVYA